jgi:hypothetical protein
MVSPVPKFGKVRLRHWAQKEGEHEVKPRGPSRVTRRRLVLLPICFHYCGAGWVRALITWY